MTWSYRLPNTVWADGRTDGIRVRETPMAWDSDSGLVFHRFRVGEGLGMGCSYGMMHVCAEEESSV